MIVVAEGVGQRLLAASSEERNALSNVKLQDIGPFLRERIGRYFQAEGIPMMLGFAVSFNVPQNALPYCALIGTLGYALRSVLMNGGAEIMLATLLVTMLGVEHS